MGANSDALLFKFNSTYQESLYGPAVSFEQELEMYELADLAGPGDNDDAYEVIDDSTEFILRVYNQNKQSNCLGWQLDYHYTITR
jgi:hypothetical protein